jgi:G:T/U-mismatch repair DNA glycosylase
MANVGTTSSSGNELVIVDEVGKMEMLYPSFVPAVNELLDSKKAGNDQRKRIILGTIPTPRYGRVIKAVEDIRAREDVIVLYVNKSNRDNLREALSEIVGQHLLEEESKSFLEDLDIKLEPFLYHRPVGAPSMTADNKSKAKANSRQTTNSQDDSCVKDQCSEPCGPLKSDNPKTLILGEMASPLPSNVEYSYCERSMWIVLGRLLGLDYKPIKESTKRAKRSLTHSCISRGLLSRKVYAFGTSMVTCMKIGGGRNKRRKKFTKSNPNDIVAFLEKNHSIQQIAFIGKKTADAFKNTVTLPDSLSIEFITLPSSSAANSRMSIDEKAAEWKSSMEIGM